MRKLDPLIARFVDDVLRLIQEAAADGLHGLLDEAARFQAFAPPEDEAPVHQVAPDARHGQLGLFNGSLAGSLPRSLALAAAGPARRTASRAKVAVRGEKAEVIHLPAGAAEITDPQWLLTIGASTMDPPAPREIAQASVVESAVEEPVPEGPASTVREVSMSSPIRLRPNETLARVSGAGVVIRRAR